MFGSLNILVRQNIGRIQDYATLVGGSVGLHPVWLLLALSVFGALFGFVGMLVAVPVAAALGVVARFLTGQYLHSRLYQGLSHRDSKK